MPQFSSIHVSTSSFYQESHFPSHPALSFSTLPSLGDRAKRSVGERNATIRNLPGEGQLLPNRSLAHHLHHPETHSYLSSDEILEFVFALVSQFTLGKLFGYSPTQSGMACKFKEQKLKIFLAAAFCHAKHDSTFEKEVKYINKLN